MELFCAIVFAVVVKHFQHSSLYVNLQFPLETTGVRKPHKHDGEGTSSNAIDQIAEDLLDHRLVASLSFFTPSATLEDSLNMWRAAKNEQPRAALSQSSRRQQPPLTAYDQDTGQMYTETQVRTVSRHHTDWIGEFKTPSLVKATRRTEDGTQRLFTIAVNAVVKQLRALDRDHFVNIPWNAAKAIWDEVIARYGTQLY